MSLVCRLHAGSRLIHSPFVEPYLSIIEIEQKRRGQPRRFFKIQFFLLMSLVCRLHAGSRLIHSQNHLL